MATYQEAFGIRNMNRLVTTFESNAANTFLQRFFTDDPVDGEIYEWDQINYSRALAPVNGPDAPSQNIPEDGMEHKTTSLAHIKLNKRIPGRRIFFMERGPGLLRPDAQGYVARQVQDLRNRMEKTIEYLAAKAFAGSIVISSTTIPGTEVAFTITFAVGTFSATTSWKLSTTNILSDPNELPALKKEYADAVGAPLRDMIFNQSFTAYLIGNQYVEAWLAKTPTGTQVFELGLLEKMGGLYWMEYNGNYQNLGGSVTPFIADDYIIGLPAPEKRAEYLVKPLGKGIIPNSAIGALGNLLMSPAPSSGFYSYALMEGDPAALKVIVGWVGLCIIKYPAIVKYIHIVP